MARSSFDSASASDVRARGDPRDVADFVLAPFEAHEGRDEIVARAADAVELIVREGLEEAQRRFN